MASIVSSQLGAVWGARDGDQGGESLDRTVLCIPTILVILCALPDMGVSHDGGAIMDATAIDQVRLNFNPQALFAINAAIGLMMFGVALDLKLADFKRIAVSPKAPAIGLVAQFILLPALTFLLTLVLRIHPSMALGMILVAACPGGNLSNLMTYLACIIHEPVL